MEHSALSTLPGELRNRIWRFSLIEPDGVNISGGARLPPLLSICRQIRQESYEIYFVENTFYFSMGVDASQWFERIGAATSRLIRQAHLRQGSQDQRERVPLGRVFERYVQSLRSNQSVQSAVERGMVSAMGLLGSTGLRPSAFQMLNADKKESLADAAWTVVKEAVDTKLAEMVQFEEQADEALDRKLRELVFGEKEGGKAGD